MPGQFNSGEAGGSLFLSIFGWTGMPKQDAKAQRKYHVFRNTHILYVWTRPKIILSPDNSVYITLQTWLLRFTMESKAEGRT